MKKDIGYKTLTIGMVIYALCGWSIRYIAYVLNILEEREALEKNIDILLFGDGFLLALFFYYAGFTIIFWSIFLLVNRKKNCFKVRTFIFSLGVMFLTYLIDDSLRVNDELIPYLINSSIITVSNIKHTLYLMRVNYIAFVILMGIGYLIQRKPRAET